MTSDILKKEYKISNLQAGFVKQGKKLQQTYINILHNLLGWWAGGWYKPCLDNYVFILQIIKKPERFGLLGLGEMKTKVQLWMNQAILKNLENSKLLTGSFKKLYLKIYQSESTLTVGGVYPGKSQVEQ